MDIFIMKRSSCASGSGKVPTYPSSFCVAITINGSGRRWEMPSTVTVCSSIASSSADCVFGVARFISSASRMFVITRPCLYSKLFVSRLYIVKPVISDAVTSGVNCARRLTSPAAFPIAFASVVFPVPGTSSTST